ncbi:unnamed protein product [Fraxinus pennsylvanica]|uniref:Uncharacterized protein n=1 Tax=Fraxinus pennsylvanica TaxID=56036 RepID=A0AAD2AG79_9LAMI|nr:unnamed protein product [Fraxinus pennsylvanica]
MANAYGMMQFLNAISELEKGGSAPSISLVWQREQYLNARSPSRITCIHHEYEQIPQSPDFMDSDKLIRAAVFFSPKVYKHIIIIYPRREVFVDETVRLSILANVRGKPGLNIPTGYYGNAFVYPAAAQMSEEYIKSVADLMVIKKRPKYATGRNFIVSDITRLGFVKADFGWGHAVYRGVASTTSNISFCTNFKNGMGEDGVVVPICSPSLAWKNSNMS